MAFCERKLAQGTMWHVRKIQYLLCFLAFLFFSPHCVSWIMRMECCLLCWLLSLLFLLFFFVSKGSCTLEIVKDLLSTPQSVDLVAHVSPPEVWTAKKDMVFNSSEALSDHGVVDVGYPFVQRACVEIFHWLYLNFHRMWWFQYCCLFISLTLDLRAPEEE